MPVRSDAQRLKRCLQSLAQGDVPIDLIVADNGSTDDSAAVALAAGARVLSLPGLRVAEVRNRAAREARADLLAFVDADHELNPNWIRAGLDILADPQVTAAGEQYYAPPAGTWVQRAYDRFRRHKPGTYPVPWLPSGNLIVRRGAFEAAGGFDTSLETCEDVDLSQRLRRQGGVLLSSDALRTVHFGDPQTLRALFLGELWRGRDSLRVTLRGPLGVRDLPGLALTIGPAAGLALGLLGLALLPWWGWWPALAGVLTFLTCSLLRAGRLAVEPRTPGAPSSTFGQVVVVALVYDVARACAHVFRGDHRVRRKAG